MRAHVPEGFLTLREAFNATAEILWAGHPLSPAVAKLREQDVKSRFTREQLTEATLAFWKVLDATHDGKSTIEGIELYAEYRPTGERLRIRPDTLDGIPHVRSYSVADLTYLTRHHHSYRYFAERFTPPFTNIQLLVKEADFLKLARKMRRMRKRKEPSSKRPGRPSNIPLITSAIEEIVAVGKWHSSQSLGALTNLVNKEIKLPTRASDATVRRALDGLFERTKNPRYQKIKKQKAGSLERKREAGPLEGSRNLL